jgi:anti-anti-sigma factor
VAFALTGRAQVHVRMSGVTFIDSSGLGALLRAHRLAQARGITFVIQDPSERVRRLLALTALDATLCLESAAA